MEQWRVWPAVCVLLLFSPCNRVFWPFWESDRLKKRGRERRAGQSRRKKCSHEKNRQIGEIEKKERDCTIELTRLKYKDGFSNTSQHNLHKAIKKLKKNILQERTRTKSQDHRILHYHLNIYWFSLINPCFLTRQHCVELFFFFITRPDTIFYFVCVQRCPRIVSRLFGGCNCVQITHEDKLKSTITMDGQGSI